MDLYRLLENFGLPVVTLAVMVWGGTKGAAVVWRDLVIPFRDTLLRRTVDFFDKLDKTMDCTLARHVDTIHAAERHEEVTMRVLDKVEEVRDQCERIERAVTGQQPPARRPDRSRRHTTSSSQPPPQNPAPGGSSTASSPTSASPPSS